MKRDFLKILSFLFLVTLMSCSKDANPDPCHDIPSSSAAFNTSYIATPPGMPSIINQDTFHIFDYVQFTPEDLNCDSYTWQIGDTTIYKKTFYLVFVNVIGPIPIQLTTRKKKKSYNCYPSDDSVKTVSKIIYFKTTHPYLGTWKGFNTDNPSDTFSITFTDLTAQKGVFWIDLSGFPKGCDDSYKNFPQYFRYFDFVYEDQDLSDSSCLSYSTFYGYLKSTEDTLVIDYDLETFYRSRIFVHKTFKGVRK